MTEYYFDLETVDVDPAFGPVITMQFRRLHHAQVDWDEPELHIVKEWEVGEKALIEKAIELGVFECGREECWDFVPVGNNLDFDYCYLYRRAMHHGLLGETYPPIDYILREKPRIDLRSIMVLMNDFKFKGSGLHTFTRKLRGDMIPYWYHKKEYDRIVQYIELEQAEFIWLLREVRPVLMVLGDRLRRKKALMEESSEV